MMCGLQYLLPLFQVRQTIFNEHFQKHIIFDFMAQMNSLMQFSTSQPQKNNKNKKSSNSDIDRKKC